MRRNVRNDSTQAERVTRAWLEYVNNEQPPLEVCLVRLAELMGETEVRDRAGLLSLLQRLGLSITRGDVEAMTFSEFPYESVQAVPFFRGRIFQIEGPCGTFLLKGYQRRQERVVHDRLGFTPPCALVGRYGWLFLERRLRPPRMSDLLNEAPRRCGSTYGSILGWAHRRSVTYNDALAPHVFMGDDAPSVVDFGMASVTTPIENDFVQMHVQVLDRMREQRQKERFLTGFKGTYPDTVRFCRFQVRLENECLEGTEVFSLFVRGDSGAYVDYMNVSPDGYFGSNYASLWE